MVTCSATQTPCSGKCVTTSSDANHCGRCGHSCQGSTCTAGQCDAKSIASNGVHYPVAAAVDQTSVYWVESQDAGQNTVYGAVKKAPIGGGGTTTLAGSRCNPQKLALTPTGIFWTEAGATNCTGGLQWLKNGTTTVVPLAASFTNPVALAVDSNNVYWIDGANAYAQTLLSLPLSDLTATPTSVSSAAACAYDMIAAGTSLVWLQSGCFARSGSVDGGRGPAGQLAAGTSLLPSGTALNGPYSEARIANDANNVYFGAHDTSNVPFIGSAPLVGAGNLTQLVSNADALGVAVDASNVYWTDRAGAVKSAPLSAPDSTVTLAPDTQTPYGIAVDANAVYWVDDVAAGAVMKVAKP